MATTPVSITIAGTNFACVPLAEANFIDIAAVYVVLCVNSDGSWLALDVGQSSAVGTRIDSHDRELCWRRECPSGNIWVCVYPMPAGKFTDKARTAFESQLRQSLNPPCGDR
jgi:hypothetical protein